MYQRELLEKGPVKEMYKRDLLKKRPIIEIDQRGQLRRDLLADTWGWFAAWQIASCVAVCCRVRDVLQWVAVCCCGLQCVAVGCSGLQWVAVGCSIFQCVALRCSVLQRHTAVRGSRWHAAACHCNILQLACCEMAHREIE